MAQWANNFTPLRDTDNSERNIWQVKWKIRLFGCDDSHVAWRKGKMLRTGEDSKRRVGQFRAMSKEKRWWSRSTAK